MTKAYHDTKKEWVMDLAQEIKREGLRVFLAEKGTYGFFTNSDGSRVVSFHLEYLHFAFSGNYKAVDGKQSGTGWRITDNHTDNYSQLLHAYPPHWCGEIKGFTTLDEHLASYQKSSKYTELRTVKYPDNRRAS